MDMVLGTLKWVPAIATHPLAVSVYVLVVGAWLLAYFRTARFKLLLERIEQVPAKDRKHVVALEMNTVIPDSISAEDWLRGRRQLYIVVAYVITLAAILTIFSLAYANRGGLEVDSVRAKTGWFRFSDQAFADSLKTPIASFKQRLDGTKHDFKFEMITRNSSNKPINITDVVITFDPDELGFLSGTLEVSNTYVVLLTEDGSGKVESESGDEEAYAWYPSEDGNMLVVKTPVQQTLAPLTADRFVIDVRFPDKFQFKGPMRKAKLSLTWNGTQKTEMRVALAP